MRQNKIVVIGDFGLDVYHIGTVRGVSAEAPIPVVDVVEQRQYPAMAGNVVENLVSLGAIAEQIYSFADSAHTVTPFEDKVPIKNRLVTTDGHQLARWDVNDHCSPYTMADLVPLITADAVIVADYGKGSITPAVVDLLHDAAIPVFVDTKSDPGPWVGSKAILFPNLTEYKQFANHYKWIEHVVLKRGAEGIAFLTYGQVVHQLPSLAKHVQCVNGAGDTVIATFALAIMEGCDVLAALTLANVAAANVVEQRFTNRTTTTEVVLARATQSQQSDPPTDLVIVTIDY